jgi:transposase
VSEDAEKQVEYLIQVAAIPKDDRVYLDESGIHEYLYKSHGYSRKGQKIWTAVSGRRYQRQNFVAAKVGKEIIAPALFNCNCDTAVFDCWVENFLIPCLKPGQVVIMDNASWHKSAKCEKMIEDAKCRILFLPAYSPQFNPIEKFWAHFKRLIAKLLPNCDSLSDAVAAAFCNVCQLI